MDEKLFRLKELENAELRQSKMIEKLLHLDRRFSFCRLSVFLAGLSGSLILYLLAQALFSAIVFIVFLVVLLFLSNRHSKTLQRLKFHKIALWVKQSNIARLKLSWEGIKSYSSASFKPDFKENDLNLLGEESLHLLIDTSVSSEGSAILRQWLKEPELSLNKIYERQELVKELTPQVRFRENLIVSALFSGRPSGGRKLLSWLEEIGAAGHQRILKRLAIALSVLALLNILLILLDVLNMLPAYWIITTLIYLSAYYLNQKKLKDTSEEAEILKKELGSLSRIFSSIEKNRFSKSPKLKEFCRAFLKRGVSPSAVMRRINSIVTIFTFRTNPFIWFLIIIVTPLDYLLAFELLRLKKRIAHILPEWLDVYYKLEALSSLANFSYLNPGYTFPEIYDEERSDYLRVEKMGHPLIPENQKIRNDFILGKENKINLITGSNMSGKSTFLRTLGINAALALMGAPVDAKKMELRLSNLFTCIKVTDSVTDGISYFYAEVKRLKTLLMELEEESKLPVFFLIDEIFKGTNNVERLIGSRSFIKALEGKRGFGAITTHDLELTKIVHEIPSARNFHFRERVSENLMTFDYLLREGPCPTTNALKIMKIEGLPIEEDI